MLLADLREMLVGQGCEAQEEHSEQSESTVLIALRIVSLLRAVFAFCISYISCRTGKQYCA